MDSLGSTRVGNKAFVHLLSVIASQRPKYGRSNLRACRLLRRPLRGLLAMTTLNTLAFTLVEIMIVVMIIGLLAAVGIPSLLRARLNANENVAKSNLRVLRDGLESYRISRAIPTYPPVLSDLAAEAPSYVDSTLFTATAPPGKNGFYFTYTFLNASQYTLYARPSDPSVTGQNTYFVDESSIIRLTDANGPPIE